MGEKLGFRIAVEQKHSSPEEEKTPGVPSVTSVFFVMSAIVILIGLGLFIGFLIWGNKDSQGGVQASISPVPSDIASLFGDAAQGQDDWTSYADTNYTVKFPANWMLKRGFLAKDDLIIYDPKSITTSSQNGKTSKSPSVYVDIVSVTASEKNALQVVDDYKKQAKEKNIDVQSEELPGLNNSVILFDNPGGKGKNIVISNNQLLANLISSTQHLSGNSTENTIIKSFQFLQQ